MKNRKENSQEKAFSWSGFVKEKFYFPSWVTILKAFSVCAILIFFIYLIRMAVGESGVVDLLTSFVWPVATVIIAMIFKSSIEGFASRMTEITAPGFSARAHSQAAVLAAFNIEDAEDTDSEDGEAGIEEVKADNEIVRNDEDKAKESVAKADGDVNENTSSVDDKHKSKSLKKSSSRDYNELKRRFDSLAELHRLRTLSTKKELKKYNVRKSVASFKNESLLFRWSKLVAVVDNIYTCYFDNKKDLNELQKMTALFSKGFVTNEQYKTFKMLYEAEELFNGFLSFEAANNYLYTIDRLEESLLRIIK